MKVPVIRVDGTNIVESIVILEYISDRYPEKKLVYKKYTYI
jgi:glutathione S-transferase